MIACKPTRLLLKIFVLLLLPRILNRCARMANFPEGNVQQGIASWYGPEFQGKRTSSREIYDMNDMTAAHNTLPFGTYVMVTNLNNDKSVVVRINDRGPFVKNRIIDLSFAAAQMIDMIGTGTAPVRIEVLKEVSPPPSSQKFSIQVGAFIRKENAEALKRELEKIYKGVYLSEFETGAQVYHRVRVKAKSREEAKKIGALLLEQGYTVLLLEEE